MESGRFRPYTMSTGERPQMRSHACAAAVLVGKALLAGCALWSFGSPRAEQPGPFSRESVSLARVPLRAAATARPRMDLQSPNQGSSAGFAYAHRFVSDGLFLERVSANLDRAGVSLPFDYDREHRAVTQTIERRVVRATQQEVKDFLMQSLEIDDIRRSASSVPSSGASSPFRFHFGVSHLAPKLDLRYRVGQGALNVSLGARGQVGLDLDTGRLASAFVHVDYDRRTKTSGLSFRLGF
jgi:hypothetical protein